MPPIDPNKGGAQYPISNTSSQNAASGIANAGRKVAEAAGRAAQAAESAQGNAQSENINEVTQRAETPEQPNTDKETQNAMRNGTVNALKNGFDKKQVESVLNDDVTGSIDTDGDGEADVNMDVMQIKNELLNVAAKKFGGRDSVAFQAINERLSSGAYDNFLEGFIEAYQESGDLDQLIENLAEGLQTVKEHAEENDPDRDTQTMDHC